MACGFGPLVGGGCDTRRVRRVELRGKGRDMMDLFANGFEMGTGIGCLFGMDVCLLG